MKQVLKQILRTTATAAVLLPYVCYRAQAMICGEQIVFPGWSQAFSLIPGLTGCYLRRAFYSLAARSCGKTAHISFGTVFSSPDLSIGDNVYIGTHCSLGAITIEDDVLIASGVSIMNGTRQHAIDRLDIPVREQIGTYDSVTIGEDAWIGERAVVTADVGRHCVVGAASLLLKPIPDYAIAVGVPARIVDDRRHRVTCEQPPKWAGESDVTPPTGDPLPVTALTAGPDA